MNYSKDVIIEDLNIKFYFEYLEWDSGFFSRPSYLLNLEKSNLGVSSLCKTMIKEKLNGAFTTVKLDTYLDSQLLKLFQECGFYYVDTEVILQYLPSKNFQLKSTSEVKIVRKKMNIDLPYEELGSVFSSTRFHTDTNITNSKADDLWINYLKNYRISEDRCMFTAEINEKIVGVILVNVNGEIATLFYVAVLHEFAGRGVGSELIEYVFDNFKKFIIKTETQIQNFNALNYYINNGLSKIENTLTVLHRWK